MRIEELEQKIQKIISYSDDKMSRNKLWNWVCDYLSGDGYLNPFDDDFDDKISKIKIIFDKIIK